MLEYLPGQRPVFIWHNNGITGKAIVQNYPAWRLFLTMRISYKKIIRTSVLICTLFVWSYNH